MDVRIIGLHSMGGIGKTTLARAIFRKFYCHFESYCFLNEVREEYERHGIIHLREKLLFELFKYKTFQSMESIPIQGRCRRTKVLIVLDDLDSIFQLNKLLPKVYEFGDGSRIIITTRDAQVLKSRADILYDVKRLNDFKALKLFCLHAFGQNYDLPGYEALSKSAAGYAHGNPLAFEVLGSSLYSKSINEWERALDKLEIDPDKEIQKALKISYDGLGDKSIQDIFLDIACFFDGEVDRDYMESILHRSERSDATIAISAILYDENKEPGNRSRLWRTKDICHVLERSMGSSRIEGILLNQSELEKDVNVGLTTFSNMCHLRFLRMHFDGIGYLCHELRYFQWDSYPLRYLPSNFSPKNLVELVMRGTQLVELFGNEHQPNGKLKKMDLSYSEHLIKIPNLSTAVNLGSINLRGCTRLFQVPSFFRYLKKLQFLYLSDCMNLKDGIEYLPLNVKELRLRGTAIKLLPASMSPFLGLSDLDLSACGNLKCGIENLPLNIKKLRLCGTAIEVVPSSIGCLMGLSHLDLYNCKRIKSLPKSIWKLKSLGWLDLSNCPNLQKIPKILEDCTSSSSLRFLKIGGCTGLKSIIELPSSLTCLAANHCTSLKTISRWRTPTTQDYDP
ncbi:disease resistance protein RPP2B-like [Ziziphus jujuba]|uniref:Disease resistance protein RPP2B-like n=1 Tax=Ziziphus jujuba TaxID=326968 RepID=A0ABM3I333_ZIZJJ|nr:disease resistance protein RPP2B-like [Ziziphus jujuba]